MLSQFSTDYDKPLLPVTCEATPYEIFEEVDNFNNFIEKIVIPQTKLYSQQKGHVLHIEAEEIKAFFGINVVMGIMFFLVLETTGILNLILVFLMFQKSCH